MNPKKKIKVLFRHRSMEMGGVEKVLLSMLNNLNRDKFDLKVALNLYQGELRDSFPKEISVKILAPGKEDFPKNKWIKTAALALRAAKLKSLKTFPIIADRYIIENDADVEIATSYTVFSDVLNSSNKKSKKIGWFHSDITSKGFSPILSELLSQITQFDYFIFGSQQAKDIFIRTYPDLKLPPNSVVINAIPIEEIKRKADEFSVPKYDIPVFVSVGRLHNRKGYHLLANAHKRLLDDGFKHQVTIIGDGEERKNLQDQINSLEIQNSFLLLGTKMNPYPYVKSADYYIMPSRSEGWPLIIAETLILQKPILATNVGGIPEMIDHKKNGYLMNYDEDSIYRGMKEFLTNFSLIKDIKEGVLRSDNQFDNRKIFISVENIILKTMSCGTEL